MIYREQMRVCTLPEMFNQSVIKYGECRCQWFKTAPGSMETTSLTYAEVGMIVRDLAAGLMSLGINEQDRVAVMAANCPQWLWADFSILGCRAVTVTIYPSFSIEAVKYIINDSGSRILYVRDQDGIDRVKEKLDEMPGLEKVIVMEDNCSLPENPMFVHLSTVRQMGRVFLHRNPYCYEKVCDKIKLWDMASIIYTSGTMGEPKGAVHTHANFLFAVQGDNNTFTRNDCMIDEKGILLSFLPLSHSYERQCGQMQALSIGCTIAYAEKPQTVIVDIQLFKPTWFLSVPRIFERIFVTLRDAASATPEGKELFNKAMDIGKKVIDFRSDEDGFVDMGFDVDLKEGLPEYLRQEYEWADQIVFSKVRQFFGEQFQVAYSASASLSADLCKAFLAMGIRVCEGYGLTETMNAVNLNNLKAILPGSVGPTNYYNEEKIADDGELLVRGGNVFQGYFNNPEVTAECFDEDGFFHTGDIVTTVYNKKLGIHYYKIIDRKKNIMVLDTGKNVPRTRVESRFSTARYIEQICAVGDNRKFVSAIVVPKFEVIIPVLKSKGIEFDENQIIYSGEGLEKVCVQVGDDFINSEEVKKLIDEDITVANDQLEDYERIKKIVLSNRKFMEEIGEITPTLKIKHRNVMKNFSNQIEEIYK